MSQLYFPQTAVKRGVMSLLPSLPNSVNGPNTQLQDQLQREGQDFSITQASNCHHRVLLLAFLSSSSLVSPFTWISTVPVHRLLQHEKISELPFNLKASCSFWNISEPWATAKGFVAALVKWES